MTLHSTMFLLKPYFSKPSNDGKILELLEYDKKWLEYITKNRMEAHEDDYDIVYDRMADKRYPDLTNAIEAFYFGEKEATEVVQMIRWKKEADQYCFKNEKALSLLESMYYFRDNGERL